MLEKGLMYNPWKEFNMVVLHKPGKPSYSTPKAYRLIALLNTMWKVMTAIIANHITFNMEKYQPPPSHPLQWSSWPHNLRCDTPSSEQSQSGIEKR